MTVENQLPYQSFIANGSTTIFTLNFVVEGKDNIDVYIDDKLLSMDYYSYDNQLNAIVFNVAPQQNAKVNLKRNTVVDRSIQYATYNNTFRPEVLNEDLDRIIRILQEQGFTDQNIINDLAQEIYIRAQQNLELDEQIQNHTLSLSTIQTIQTEEIKKRITGDQEVALASRAYTDLMLTMNNTNPSIFSGIADNIVITATGESQRKVNEEQVNINNYLKVFSNNQTLLNTTVNYKLSAIDATFVTPEAFGAKANDPDFDNTNALNSAFATGKDVYSSSDNVYTCNGNVKTKGQNCIGGWKIRSSKPVVGMSNWTNTCSTYSSPCDFTYLQGIYFAYAYDLAELLAVRELGYNTILHYGGMHISGYDNDGTVQDLLNNAKTAGVQVILGTQNSLNGMSLESFVNAHKNHTSLLGFLIADEPTHNKISVAQQKAKIDTMKALTNKPLACSDFTYDAFTEVLASGYDYIFGDVYNNANETQEQTLYKMRAWLGLTSKRHPSAKVLPAVMGFKYTNGASLEDIIATSKIFAKACGGNFSCFAWDGLGESVISNSIRDTVAFQDLSKTICSYKTGVYKIPECYAWGGVTELLSQVNYGLQDVLKTQVRVDPYSTGFYEGVNSYPAQMNGATVDGERTSVAITVGQAVSGIWFKHTYGAFISDIKMKRKNHFTVQSGMLAKGDADVILTVRGSSVGGYGLGSALATLPKDGSVATVVFDNIGINDSFCIKYDCSVDPQFYRTYVRGVYVTSDW